jgi:hypothetical protein
VGFLDLRKLLVTVAAFSTISAGLASRQQRRGRDGGEE